MDFLEYIQSEWNTSIQELKKNTTEAVEKANKSVEEVELKAIHVLEEVNKAKREKQVILRNLIHTVTSLKGQHSLSEIAQLLKIEPEEIERIFQEKR